MDGFLLTETVVLGIITIALLWTAPLWAGLLTFGLLLSAACCCYSGAEH